MGTSEVADGSEESGALGLVRQFFALERDIIVLSLAMFAFSLGFQMTTRFLPDYLWALGGTGIVVGLFGTVGNVISAVYPYPGGAVSDRIGSRYALTVFGVLSTVGFVTWLVAPEFGTLVFGPVVVRPWVWIFVGLFLAQAWKSFGLGATFAIVKQATDPSKLAAGFASTETFRRTAFLVGPVLAAVLIALHEEFTTSFQTVLAVAVVFGILGTAAQHVLYTGDEDEHAIGKRFTGLSGLRKDLRGMPPQVWPLLIGDTLVRFANGMVYVFFVIVVTRLYRVDVAAAIPLTSLTIHLSPQAFFGSLLGIEMAVALLSMMPAAKLAERVGLKPVVWAGFVVYAIFPVLLISAPATPVAMLTLFAFSGLRFAGLPAHKALIVGPTRAGVGGRVTGSYYLVRNVVVIPSAALGGLLWEGIAVTIPVVGYVSYAGSPTLAFGLASAIGLLGTGYFLVAGEEFDAYS